MEMLYVESSTIRMVGYDPAEHILQVDFRNYSVYEFLEFPEAEFIGFLQAASKGRYFHAHIRDRYPSRRVYHSPFATAASDEPVAEQAGALTDPGAAPSPRYTLAGVWHASPPDR